MQEIWDRAERMWHFRFFILFGKTYLGRSVLTCLLLFYMFDKIILEKAGRRHHFRQIKRRIRAKHQRTNCILYLVLKKKRIKWYFKRYFIVSSRCQLTGRLIKPLLSINAQFNVDKDCGQDLLGEGIFREANDCCSLRTGSGDFPGNELRCACKDRSFLRNLALLFWNHTYIRRKCKITININLHIDKIWTLLTIIRKEHDNQLAITILLIC